VARQHGVEASEKSTMYGPQMSISETNDQPGSTKGGSLAGQQALYWVFGTAGHHRARQSSRGINFLHSCRRVRDHRRVGAADGRRQDLADAAVRCGACGSLFSCDDPARISDTATIEGAGNRPILPPELCARCLLRRRRPIPISRRPTHGLERRPRRVVFPEHVSASSRARTELKQAGAFTTATDHHV